ncbi:MAG: lamin tail domain-containing protein, partial [Planctomycetota bacterium]
MREKIRIIAALMCAGAAQSQVVINEVMHDPPGSESNWEYIELYGKPGMDLTGYAIGLFKGGADENGDDLPETIAEIDEAFTLDGLTLGADGFLVLVNSGAGDAAFFTDPSAT